MRTFWGVMAIVTAASAVVLGLAHDSLAIVAFLMTLVFLFLHETSR